MGARQSALPGSIYNSDEEKPTVCVDPLIKEQLRMGLRLSNPVADLFHPHQPSLGSRGRHRHSLAVIRPRPFQQTEQASVFSIRRNLRRGSLDLSPDNSSGSMIEEDDESFPIPPYSPIRRGGLPGGSFKNVKKAKRNGQTVPKDSRSKDSLTRVFNSNLFFSHLNADEREEITNALFQETFEPGDVIMKQGDEGDNFYIIDQGRVEVRINDEVVTEIGEGGSFGELALMYGTPRAATIVAKTQLTLWGIDRDSYRSILMESTRTRREMYEDFLSRVPILEKLYDWERMTIADALEEVEFSDGVDVVKEGDEGEDFFIIVQGEASVSKLNSVTGEEQEVTRLRSSEYFGEVALLLDQPRAATVRAVGELRCVKLDRARFERLLGPCSDIMKRKITLYSSSKLVKNIN